MKTNCQKKGKTKKTFLKQQQCFNVKSKLNKTILHLTNFDAIRALLLVLPKLTVRLLIFFEYTYACMRAYVHKCDCKLEER